MEHLILEIGFAFVLIAAAGIIASKLRFSIVPILIISGLIVGPHMPHIGVLDLRFIKSAPLIDFMARIGVLFLLFYLGLEFSLSRLLRAKRSIIASGIIYMVINISLALALSCLAGWPLKETLIAVAIMVISSSAIVSKMIVELKRTANPETEIILGLMMFQDVFVVVYLSFIYGFVSTGRIFVSDVFISSVFGLALFVGVIFAGKKLTPFLNRWLNIPSDEVFLLVLFAVLVMGAGLFEILHLSEAVGALIIGLILSETEHVERIEYLIVPFRDFFGALFFFSFGLNIDPLALHKAVWVALAAVALTLMGNFASGILVGRAMGLSLRASTNLGLTIISRGEFSIILADLARKNGLLPIIQPFTALYVLILAVLGPLLTKESKWIYFRIERVLQIASKIKRPERSRYHS